MYCLFSLVLFLALLCASNAYTGENRWERLNKGSPVCFLGLNNQPGVFHSQHNGFIAAIKLVHRSGWIRCGSRSRKDSAKHNSYFGCHQWPGRLEKHPLNVVVTNSENQIKFPKSGFFPVPGSNPGFWYGIDGMNSKSTEIVLQHSFATPYYVNSGQVLKVWYGEDLMDKWEGDNVGRVCVDVYGYFI